MDALAVLRDYLAGFTNLQVVGRNGMHKYNNQDHSMVTAILAVRNLLGEHHDSGPSTPTTSITRSRTSTWISKTSTPACPASRRRSRTCRHP